MMLAVVIILIALVQAVQTAGDYLARRANRHLRHRKREPPLSDGTDRVWTVGFTAALASRF